MVRKRGVTWTAYWKIGGRAGRQFSRGGFKTKREAQNHLTGVLHAVKTGTYVGPDRQTFSAVFDDWLFSVSARLRPTTVDKYRRDFNRYVRPKLGSTPLQSLTALHIDRLYGELLAALSPTSVSHVHALTHKVLADAVRKGLLARNIAEAASPPKPPKPGERHYTIWSRDQLGIFLRSVEGDRLYALWRLYAVTGCRRGEALAATWDDIDLDAGRWVIRRALGVLNGSPVFGLTKTGRVRTVRLDAATVAALRTHRKAQLEERLRAGSAYQDYGLVFCKEDGTHLHPNIVTRVFGRVAAQAGLPRIRLHDVRHSAITAMLDQGVHVKVVAERVGHASTSFTQDVYAKALPDMQRDAATRIAAAIDGLAPARG
jgi:integrase